MVPTKGKKDPVKKNMDKFHKPKTHRDKTKYNRKEKSKKLDPDNEQTKKLMLEVMEKMKEEIDTDQDNE